MAKLTIPPTLSVLVSVWMETLLYGASPATVLAHLAELISLKERIVLYLGYACGS